MVHLPEAGEEAGKKLPLRVMVFPDRPDCILFYVSESGDGAFEVPVLQAPFDKKAVMDAFKAAGLECRITETVPGRWTTAMSNAKNADRAERAQKAKQRTMAQAAMLRGGTEMARSRAEAIEQKLAVDERIRETKTWISNAASKARTRGIYEDRDKYQKMVRRLEELKQESQALQVQITQLNQKEKAENRQIHREESEKFCKAAYSVLDPEVIEEVLAEVARREDKAESEARSGDRQEGEKR